MGRSCPIQFEEVSSQRPRIASQSTIAQSGGSVEVIAHLTPARTASSPIEIAGKPRVSPEALAGPAARDLQAWPTRIPSVSRGPDSRRHASSPSACARAVLRRVRGVDSGSFAHRARSRSRHARVGCPTGQPDFQCTGFPRQPAKASALALGNRDSRSGQ
jgi:hypothetical protein